MLRRNTALTVSPTEQIYHLNRTNGLNGPLGLSTTGAIGTAAAADPEPFTKVILTVAATLAKLFHLGGDPNRDIHIPAQNATVQGFGNILNILDTKKANGSLSALDIRNAANGIVKLDTDFRNLTNNLSAQYPATASRYQAGYNDVHALEQKILSDLTPAHYGVPDSIGIVDKVSDFFSGGGSGGGINIGTVAILAAGIFFLPRMLKR